VKKAAIAVVGLAVAAIGLAQLSKYKDWGKSAEAYFLTPSEKDAWSRVRTDEEATAFVAEYWVKRDPNPATSANEFRDEINRRIAAADEQFKMRNKRGSETARGRLLVTLGLPTRVSTQRAQDEGGLDTRPGATTPTLDTGGPSLEQISTVIQTWTYAKDRFDPSLQIGELRVRINVDTQRGTEDLMSSGGVEKAIAKIAEKSIANAGGAAAAAPVAPVVPPAATGPGAGTSAPPAAAPVPAAPAPAAPAPAAPAPAAPAPPPPAATGATAPAAPSAAPEASAAAPAAAATASIPAASRTVLEGIAKDKVEGSFWAGPFRSISGESFYALQFYLPADKAAEPLRFGGIVWNESNQAVGSYWEDAALNDVKSGSRTDKVFDRSITLPAGSYRGSFGLFSASSGVLVAGAGTTFKLETPAGEFAVSPLILANTLTPLTKRPNPTDPFVFGMEKPIKVEPKGDRKFAKEDSLWYFYAVSNPTLPAATSAAPPPAPATPPGTPGAAPAAPAAADPKPRIMTRITVLRDGENAFEPLTSPADLQPLGNGYYASGSEIPLESFQPGYYTFGIQVRDLNAPKDSAANKGIERKEDFVVLNADGSLPARAAGKPTAKPKAPAKKP
jgi:GWxTD domain-containing protein